MLIFSALIRSKRIWQLKYANDIHEEESRMLIGRLTDEEATSFFGSDDILTNIVLIFIPLIHFLLVIIVWCDFEQLKDEESPKFQSYA